jgi:hypothetical protein
MRRVVSFLIVLMVIYGGLDISHWAASGLPTVASMPGALIMSYEDSLPNTFQCDDDMRIGSIIPVSVIPVMITFAKAWPPFINDGTTIALNTAVASHTAATQNVDGSWSISPWWLFRAAWHSGSDPRSLAWRVLLAYPVLTTVSMKRGQYLNSHFCKQES